MANSPDYGIPYISQSQSQPEVTHNEALNMMQLLLNGVIDRAVNTPAVGPSEGDAYILGAAPTGAWSGRANCIAAYYGGSWIFLPGDDSDGTPITIGARHEGLTMWVRDEDTAYTWDGSSWIASGGGISGIAVEDDGVTKVTTAVRLNFTGSGVTVSTGSTEATINIPGGGTTSIIGHAYDFGFAFSTAPQPSAVIQRVRLARKIAIGTNFSGAFGGVVTPTTVSTSYTITVKDDGATIGTIVVSSTGGATFATSTAFSGTVAAGSEITFEAPSSTGETIADGSFVIAALIST